MSGLPLNDKDAIGQRLLNLFADAFQIETPAPDLDLIDSGILDSLQLVELLYRLEREFATTIAIEDVDLDDLRTLNRIARLIGTKSASKTPTLRSGAHS